MSSSKSLSIICPTYRNPKYLDLFLKSAVENRILTTTDIIVVVDGFYEESKDIIEKYSGIFVITFDENKGMQAALNYGVAQAETEYVFIVNDDNVLPTRWDERILKEVENTEKFWGDKTVLTIEQCEDSHGMFSFTVLPPSLGINKHTMLDVRVYESWLAHETLINDGNRPQTLDGNIFPFVIKKKWYMAIGGFDTFYNSANAVDWDTFLRLEILGFKGIRTRNVHLYHFGSTVLAHGVDKDTFSIKAQEAARAYEWKWGTPLYNQSGTNSKIPPDRKFRGFVV